MKKLFFIVLCICVNSGFILEAGEGSSIVEDESKIEADTWKTYALKGHVKEMTIREYTFENNEKHTQYNKKYYFLKNGILEKKETYGNIPEGIIKYQYYTDIKGNITTIKINDTDIELHQNAYNKYGKLESTVIEKNDTCKVLITYHYNNKNIASKTQRLDCGEYDYGEPQSVKWVKQYFYYNKKGRMTKHVTIYSDQNISEEEHFRYDSLGRLIYKRRTGGGDDKKIIFTISYRYKGNSPRCTEKTEMGYVGTSTYYTYDSNGNCIKEISGGHGNLFISTEMKYESHGNIIEKISRIPERDEKLNMISYSYTYWE